MSQGSIARRYARALIEVAGAGYEQAGAELSAFSAALSSVPEAAETMLRPGVSRGTRERALEAIVRGAGFSPAVGNFLGLLLDRGRLDQLPGIVEAYRAMADERAGRLRAHVAAAGELPTELVDELTRRLGEATGKNVVVETSVDRELLGGVVARAGNVVYDGSLRTQLESLRRQLTGGTR